MQLTTIFAATLANITPLVSAQYAVVANACTFPIFLQSVPYDSGEPAGPVLSVLPGGTYQEAFNPDGSTIKMGTTSRLGHPLFFGYSLTSTPYDVYYEFKNTFGNPFAGDTNELRAKAGCPAFYCPPNSPDCYSNSSGSKVYACGRPTNLTASLCT